MSANTTHTSNDDAMNIAVDNADVVNTSADSANGETAAKRARGDSNGQDGNVTITPIKDLDIDFLIGDLIKEELQLLVTRLLRVPPSPNVNMEEAIRQQYEKIILSRQRQTFYPDSSLALKGATPYHGLPVLSPGPVASSFLSPAGYGGGHSPRMGRTPLRQPAFDEAMGDMDDTRVDVKQIRRRVKGAFQRLKNKSSKKRRMPGEPEEEDKFRLDGDTIRGELQKAKDLVLIHGDTRNGLSILEAVTDEFVTQGTELGEQNVEGYDDMLNEIGSDWVEVFLSDAGAKLDEQERKDWTNQLSQWDKSADQEEGPFAIARWAAKLGWNDTHLKNVLAGEAIGKFKEPAKLSVIRLNILEREKKFEQAINLATAVDLDHYCARFQLKLGKKDDAISTALKLNDPGKVYTIAQVARSIDVKVAFTIALHSIALAATAPPPQNNPSDPGWSAESNERCMWLADLCITNNLLGDLVKGFEERAKNKTFQYNMAKILKDKEKLDTAIELAKICLIPYPKRAPSADEEEAKKAELEKFFAMGQLPPPEQVHPGTIIPFGLGRWMWEVAYDIAQLQVGGPDAKLKMVEVVSFVLEHVQDVNQLLDLAREMLNRREYAQTFSVGKKVIELSDTTKAKEKAQQEKQIEEQVKNSANPPPQPTTPQEKLRQQLQQQLQARENPPLPLVYNATPDNNKLKVCQIMFTAAFDSKLSSIPAQKVATEAIADVVTLAMDNIADPTHLLQLAQLCVTRQEYIFVLKIGNRVYERVQAIQKDRSDREPLRVQHKMLQDEQQQLFAQRKTLTPEQIQKLIELTIVTEKFKLLPPYANYYPENCDNLNLQVAKMTLTAVLDSKVALDKAQQMTDKQLMETLELAVQQLLDVKHLMSLAELMSSRQQFTFVFHIGRKVHERVEAMTKLRKEREAPRLQFRIMQQEQDYLNQLRKTFTPEQQDAFNKLEQQIAAQPPVPFYDPYDANKYDLLHLQVVKVMLFAALACRSSPDDLVTKESKEEAEKVISGCLDEVKDPQCVVKLARDLSNKSEFHLVVEISNKAQDRIKELEKARVEREPYEQQLAAIRQEMAQALAQKKQMTPEQTEQWRTLELQNLTQNTFQPSYTQLGASSHDSITLDLAKLMLNAALDNRIAVENKITNALNPPTMPAVTNALGLLVQPIPMDVVMTEEQIKQDRAAAKQMVDKVTSLCMQNVIDPQHLSKLTTECKGRAEYQLVLTFGQAVLKRTAELEKIRKEREFPEKQLQTLLDEQAQLATQRKTLQPQQLEQLQKLQQQLDAMQKLPHYASGMNPGYYLDLILSVIRSMVGAVLDERKNLEDNIKLSGDKMTVDEIVNSRKSSDESISLVVNICLNNLPNPSHQLKLIQDFFARGYYAIVQQLGEKNLGFIEELRKRYLERESLKIQIDLLKQEQKLLAVERKDLKPAQKKELEELEAKQFAQPGLPNYCYETSNTWDDRVLNTCTQMLVASMEHKRVVEQKIHDAESQMSDDNQMDELNAEKETAAKEIQFAAAACMKSLQDPSHIQSVTQEAYNRKEYPLVLQFGQRCFERINELFEDVKKNEEKAKELTVLQQEHAVAQTARKHLKSAKRQQLRGLSLDQQLNAKLSSYRFDVNQYDNICLAVSRLMVISVLDTRALLQEKMAADPDLSDEVKEQNLQKSKEQAEKVLLMCLKNLNNPSNLYALTNDLNKRVEYSLVIKTGQRCQERIKILKDSLEQRSLLQDQINQLMAKVPLSAAQQAQVEALQLQIQQLPPVPPTENLRNLNQHNQAVANMMISAAKFDGNKEVLRDQAILVFKGQVNAQKFDEVRLLTPDDQWPAMRKELLDFVTNNTDETNILAKVDLLLREGLWKECIAIFPENGSVDLFERLWNDVEANAPDRLKELLPLAEKLYKRELQTFYLAPVEKILDLVQNKEPDFVVGLCNKGSEIMLLNIIPSQYSTYVEYLKMFRKRLRDDLKRRDDWDDFINASKKKNKGKKKLMQLIQAEDL